MRPAAHRRRCVHAGRRCPPRASASKIETPPADKPSPDLKRALADGDLGDIAEALCATVTPPAADIDALRARIDDDAQLDALDLLQRARWAGGDPRVARETLRRVFAKGVRIASPMRATRSPEPLPPLYPPA